MNSVHEIMSKLRGLRVKIHADGGRLRLDAPKGAVTPELRDAIVERKGELLRFLQDAERMVESGGDLAIRPLPRDQELPLSFAQQRLWFLEQMEGLGSVYHIPIALRLSGSLDRSALTRALTAILERHEAVRCGFPSVRGRARLVIAPPQPFQLPIESLAGRSPAALETALIECARREAEQPFDLAQPPLVRARLLVAAPDDHVLLLTMHHIISDGWSVGVMIRELSLLYAGFMTGVEPALPALPVQYVDYAAWQRGWLSGKVLEVQRRFWTRKLAGAPELLTLPTDHVRPAVQSYEGRTLERRYSRATRDRVQELARRAKATPFMLVQAAFALLLSKYAGQKEVVLGTTISGRNRTETEHLIGFFVNTLALRLDLSGNPSFMALLERTRTAALDAEAHQELPFEQIVEAVSPRRNLAYAPLFQVLINLGETGSEPIRLPGLSLTPFHAEQTTAKFDLHLTVQDSSDGLIGVFEYATSLFETNTISMMADRFGLLLDRVVADPDLGIDALELMTESDRRQLSDWNRTSCEYPRDRCIHELFEEWAAQTPESTAVVSDARTLTYAALDGAANRLALRLASLGVGLDAAVAIYSDRTPEMVIAALATLKAGGAYLPLNPEYPVEQLRFMAEDAGVSAVLVQAGSGGEDLFPNHLMLDLERELAADAPPASPPARAGSSVSLAYVMYTSGSTGRPKAVMVPHRGVVRLVREANYAQLGRETVMLHLSAVSFDLSTLELWAPLLNGGRITLFTDRALNLDRLAETLARTRPNILWLTASLFNLVIDTRPEMLRGVAQILAGGEALSAPHVRAALERLPDACLINGYGPTENTTFTTCHAIAPTCAQGRAIPIGRPVANTTVWLLDERGRPVPPGIPGELCAGGDGLARGYHNRPGLTAEKWIPHPFAETPGERLYRTGDLARFLPDGALDYLDRIDQQVKLRGLRIELGEIEAALADAPGVGAAAVLLRDDLAGGDKRLIAFLTTDEDRLDLDPLRDHLRARVPGFMVPAHYRMLERLPLTPHGKIDRAALRALPFDAAADGSSDRDLTPPTTPTEGRVVEPTPPLISSAPMTTSHY